MILKRYVQTLNQCLLRPNSTLKIRTKIKFNSKQPDKLLFSFYFAICAAVSNILLANPHSLSDHTSILINRLWLTRV
jgi:hypothetical protein